MSKQSARIFLTAVAALTLMTGCGEEGSENAGAANSGSEATDASNETTNPAATDVFWYLKDVRTQMCPNWLNRPENDAVEVAFLLMQAVPGDLDLSAYSETDVRAAILDWYQKNCD